MSSEKYKLDRDAVGRRLAKVITKHWKTQADAARELGVSPGALSRYVHGTDLPLWVVVEVARRANVSLDWLLIGRRAHAATTPRADIMGSIDRLNPHELLLVRNTKYGSLDRGDILILQVEHKSTFNAVHEMVFGRPVFQAPSRLLGNQEPPSEDPKDDDSPPAPFRIALDTETE